jgi:mannose-1-phosphate guanylyltransferase
VSESQHTWALVLAAGEGSRLRRLTTISEGVAVPKQFCSLRGGPSLLYEAIRRAEAIAPRERICTIVAHQHRRWWEGALHELPSSNVIVQPENRGTANGILLPLLHIMQRDPDANIVLLPSDQYVRDEAVLTNSLRDAVRRLKARSREIVLLGLEPEEIDPDLGYIVPAGRRVHGAHSVRQFVEKPSTDAAEELIRTGALWNVFIIAARAHTLLELFTQRFPEIVAGMRAVVAQDAGHVFDPVATTHLYRTLPDIDFSRHVLQGAEPSLRVLPAPACGWSDLGTPERVALTLRRTRVCDQPVKEHGFSLSAHLNLARQHLLLEAAV